VAEGVGETSLGVAVGVALLVGVGVGVSVGVCVCVRVGVGVADGPSVGASVLVTVGTWVGVSSRPGVFVGVATAMGSGPGLPQRSLAAYVAARIAAMRTINSSAIVPMIFSLGLVNRILGLPSYFGYEQVAYTLYQGKSACSV
jgi:hypothetical protein